MEALLHVTRFSVWLLLTAIASKYALKIYLVSTNICHFQVFIDEVT